MKIAYYIGHVESASEERKQNYNKLNSVLGAMLPKLNVTSTLFKSVEDIYSLQKTYPWIQIKQVKHNVLRGPEGGVVTNEYGMVENALFPRWPGEIGLLFSLYKGLKKFLQTDYTDLLWLEDDTIALEYFENNFFIYMNYLPEQYDFISLSTRHDQKYFYTDLKELYNINNEAFCKIFQLWWAGAILISRKGAEKYIKYFENEIQAYPWDWLIFNIRSDNYNIDRFETYALKPDLPELFQLNYEIAADSTIIHDPKDILKL